MIDPMKPVDIRIKGFSHGAWAVIATSPAEIDTEGKSSDEVLELLEQGLDQFNHVINQSFKENNSGYIQLGNTSVNILKFDAIQVCCVQFDQEHYALSAK